MGIKRRFFRLLPIPLILMVGTLSMGQEDIESVNDSAFLEKRRPPVSFAHDDHNEKAAIEDCHTCHHVYEDGKKIEDDSSEGMECSECHVNDKEKITIELSGVYHKQCKGCHMAQKAGPVLCSECHKK